MAKFKYKVTRAQRMKISQTMLEYTEEFPESVSKNIEEKIQVDSEILKVEALMGKKLFTDTSELTHITEYLKLKTMFQNYQFSLKIIDGHIRIKSTKKKEIKNLKNKSSATKNSKLIT